MRCDYFPKTNYDTSSEQGGNKGVVGFGSINDIVENLILRTTFRYTIISTQHNSSYLINTGTSTPEIQAPLLPLAPEFWIFSDSFRKGKTPFPKKML